MIIKLERRTSDIKRLQRAWDVVGSLLSELQKREIPADLQETINNKIVEINAYEGSDKDLLKLLEKLYVEVLKLIKERLGITPQKYYQNMWLSFGMAIFGLPLGVMMSTITGNMVFLALGLPIGLTLGLAIGRSKDKKAMADKKQIKVEEW
ncbi:hypothetical protein ACT29H_11980 [Thermophagus sp. OGC60D27]|uniref:hypothetical protein n=1 Tax=Thermophagus sp. OGC60D27 TaxID=3458415 RepID=UPI004037DF43